MTDKNVLTLDNAPKARGTIDDTVDITPVLKLEEEVAKDAAVEPTAANKLADFRLSHVARALLDKACVNVSENKGTGIEDPVARDTTGVIADLFSIADYDIGNVVNLIITNLGDDPKAALSMSYKACYALQKALNFVGNMAYRRALDPKSDFDLEQFVDYREEERSAPYGLDPIGAFDINDAMYEGQPDEDIVFNALEECHILLQLLTEMCGWDPEQPMPYAVIQNKDESFEQIHDLQHCLDLMEIRYKESRARRQQNTLDALRKVQVAARAALTGAQKK